MKYKEYRILIITIIILIGVLGLSGYFIAVHNFKKLIISATLIFSTMLLLLSRYNMKLFDTSMIVYELKIIGILPIYIDYKDVKDVELLSKHRIVINHEYKSKVYITNAKAFYDELLEKIDNAKKKDNL